MVSTSGSSGIVARSSTPEPTAASRSGTGAATAPRSTASRQARGPRPARPASSSGPRRSPIGLAADAHHGVEALGVVGALVAQLVDGQLRRTRGRPAPGAGSCSRGRPGPSAAVVDPVAEQAEHEPLGRAASRRRGRRRRSPPPWRRPGSTACARPPAASSPLPSSSASPRSSSAASSARAAAFTTDAAHLGQLALGQVGVAPVDVVGHDQPEHGVAEELEPLVRLVTRRARRTTTDGPAPAASSVEVGERAARVGRRSDRGRVGVQEHQPSRPTT